MKISETWLDQTADGRNFVWALAAGLGLELAALALLLPFLAKPVPPAQVQAPVKLTIDAAPHAPKPPQPAPKPKQPPPIQKTPTLPKPPPVPVARPHPVPRPAVHHVIPPSPTPKPLPDLRPPVQAAPPPPAPAPPSAGQVDLFRDAVRRAVQEVANTVYPQSTQESGTVEITINYLNGRATSVALTRSSGFPLLDAAALQAGRIAPYPPPPPAFADHVFPWTVSVIFQAAPPSINGD